MDRIEDPLHRIRDSRGLAALLLGVVCVEWRRPGAAAHRGPFFLVRPGLLEDSVMEIMLNSQFRAGSFSGAIRSLVHHASRALVAEALFFLATRRSRRAGGAARLAAELITTLAPNCAVI